MRINQLDLFSLPYLLLYKYDRHMFFFTLANGRVLHLPAHINNLDQSPLFLQRYFPP